MRQEEEIIQEPYGEQAYIDRESASLLTQTNPTSLLQDLEHSLRGEVPDYENECWKKPEEAKPLVNDKGVRKIMTTIRIFVNTNCILSNLTIHEVYDKTHEIADLITLDICSNYEEYEADKSDFDRIVVMVSQMCFFAMKRSLNEGERRFLRSTFKHQETNVQHRAPQGQSKWGSFFSKKSI